MNPVNLQQMIEFAFVTVVAAYGLWVKIRKEINDSNERQFERTSETLSFEMSKLNGFVDAILESMPYPAWVKIATEEGATTLLRMKYVNSSYEQRFQVSRHAYIGKTDWEVWPEDVAKKTYANDMAVLGSGKALVFEEEIQLPGDANAKSYVVENLPINRGKYRGVVGFLKPVAWYQRTTRPEQLESSDMHVAQAHPPSD